MKDLIAQRIGNTGRITLNRPSSLNALTHDMCLAIENAFDAWQQDETVTCVVLDAKGEKAFCAGGDIAELHRRGTARDFTYGQRFWADEYRLNAKIFNYPKPVVSLLQGFTMGGGVGIGCHGSHRIVGATSRIAMPECGIGLIPDVGGTYILSRAPGFLGAFLGMTGTRMSAADAIYAGFADLFIPEDRWRDLIAELEAGMPADALADRATDPGTTHLFTHQSDIDSVFEARALEEITERLKHISGEFAEKALGALRRNAPLSMAVTRELLHILQSTEATIETALDLEYRFTYRAQEHGDLLEGIRAAIIDKDRSPQWQFADGGVPREAVEKMLYPLDADALKLEETR